MKLAAIGLAIVMMPATWAQRPLKQPVRLNPNGATQLQFKLTPGKARSRAVSPRAVAPAPIAVQVFLSPSNGTLSAYGIVTASIPAGSSITGTMTLLDDGSAIDFQQVGPLQSALNPGDFFTLPQISNFGDLWNPGAFDYAVVVIPSRGGQVQSDGVFLVGETVGNSDLASFTPVISTAVQTIDGNKNVIMKITGLFTGNPVQVIVSDLFANYIAPAGSITSTTGEVDVIMEQLQDPSQTLPFDLTSLDSVLVTVCDQNICDTIGFRYVPPPAGTFN